LAFFFQIAEKDNKEAVLRSIVAAQIDHHWGKSSEYPKRDLTGAVAGARMSRRKDYSSQGR
jgi:hypothetical protein